MIKVLPVILIRDMSLDDSPGFLDWIEDWMIWWQPNNLEPGIFGNHLHYRLALEARRVDSADLE